MIPCSCYGNLKVFHTGGSRAIATFRELLGMTLALKGFDVDANKCQAIFQVSRVRLRL